MIFRRTSSSLFIVIIIVILGATIVFLSSGVLSKIRSSSGISVKVSKVSAGNIQNNLDVKVIIKSQNYKEYYGNQLRVKKIYVERGDYVEKGQKLIVFDNNDMLSQYTQAQIQLENAILQKNQMVISSENFRKQKQNIQDEIDRIKEAQEDNESFVAELEESFEDSKILSSKNSLTISDYSDEIDKLVKEGEEFKKVLSELERQRDAIPEITDDQIKLLDNSITLAENNLKNIQEKLDMYKDVEADFNGVVTDININEGSYSQPGSIILILQDIQNIKGISLISQQNISKVKVGQEVVINDPIGMYTGKISEISELAINSSDYLNFGNSVDFKDNSLMAEIEILNPNDRLKIDFDLDGKILLEDTKDILKVPIESVLYDEKNLPYVFVVKDGVAYKNYIVTGGVSNNYIQVVEGLNVSENVIVNPPKELTDKTKVKVVGGK